MFELLWCALHTPGNVATPDVTQSLLHTPDPSSNTHTLPALL